MTAKTMRLLGILFLMAAAIIAILNLKSVAGLGMNSLATILLISGIVFVRRAKAKSTV